MRRLTAALAAALIISGCSGDRPAAPGLAWELLDGFESDPLWAHDSADDHAELSCVAGDAIQGATALVVRAHAGTRGKIMLRKDVDLDCSDLAGLCVSLRVADGPPPLFQFALRGADGGWFESPRVQLQPGWNRDLAWTIAGNEAWAKSSPRIERLLLLVIPQGGDCTVAIDDLRAAGAWRWRSDPAELRAVAPAPSSAQRNQPVETSFIVAWPSDAHAAKPAKPTPGERLMRRMVAGGAWITAPDGERWFQPAACLGPAPDPERPLLRYAVRFTPDRAGTWLVAPGLDAGGGRWAWAGASTVVVDAEAANPGAVRIDTGDRRWLALADGSFFWPLGMNVAWAGDYRPWLELLQRDGCNAARVWLCPWSNPLDVAGDLHAVNQVSAGAIDALLDDALARGIRIQLCLAYHGWFGPDWERNPFNAANGGPVADAREFWIDGQARAGFRRVLDYVSARWGHHPGLLAWELVNEADLAPRYRDKDLVDWHREMAAHLARIDRRRHPVTTSVAVPGRLPELWRLGDIDLVNVHRYETDPLRSIAAVAADVSYAGKPGWAAEAGRDWTPVGAVADPDGAYLRQALWWSWAHGLAASSWAWWWDVQVQNQGLTRHHAALARFLAGEDPRGAGLRSVAVGGDGLAVAALIGPDRGYVYAADPQAAQPRAGAAASPARRIALSGLAPGEWMAEVWDPLAGTALDAVTVQVGADGTLDMQLPAGRGEQAWKLRRRLPLRPDVRLP